jgi:hypothetical protein
MNSHGEGLRTPYNTWWGLQQSLITSSITSAAPSRLPRWETQKCNKKSAATQRSSAPRMQLSSNALESHSISLKMCNQAKRWVEGLFSSSKDVSRSARMREMPPKPRSSSIYSEGVRSSCFGSVSGWSDAPVDTDRTRRSLACSNG